MNIKIGTLITAGCLLVSVVGGYAALQAQVNTQGENDKSHTEAIKDNTKAIETSSKDLTVKIDTVAKDAQVGRVKVFEHMDTKQQSVMNKQQTHGESLARIEAILSQMNNRRDT